MSCKKAEEARSSRGVSTLSGVDADSMMKKGKLSRFCHFQDEEKVAVKVIATLLSVSFIDPQRSHATMRLPCLVAVKEPKCVGELSR